MLGFESEGQQTAHQIKPLNSVALVGALPGSYDGLSANDALRYGRCMTPLILANIPLKLDERDIVSLSCYGRDFLCEDRPYDVIVVCGIPGDTNDGRYESVENRTLGAWYNRAVQSGAQLIITSGVDNNDIGPRHFEGEAFRLIAQKDPLSYLMRTSFIQAVAGRVCKSDKVGKAIWAAAQSLETESSVSEPATL